MGTFAVISLILGLTAAWISGGVAIRNSKDAIDAQRESEERQNQYNLDAMEKQNQYNIEAEQREQQYIAEQNEYNSPVQQMQRNREAGVNPILGLDTGNQTSSVSSIGNNAIANTALDPSGLISKLGDSITGTIDNSSSMFQNLMIQQMQYQNEVAKLDAEIDWHNQQFGLDNSKFEYQQKLDAVEQAYRQTRDAVNDKYNQDLLELKKQGLAQEQYRDRENFILKNKELELRIAADKREAELHRIKVKQVNADYQYNQEAREQIKKYKWPNEQKRAKIEELTLSMTPEQQTEFVEILKKENHLRYLQVTNEISYAEYVREARELWDKNTSHFWNTDDSRFQAGTGGIINPYDGRGYTMNAFFDACKQMADLAR